jgi:hypothetical protein
VRPPRDPIQSCSHHHRSKLPAPHQGSLEARTAVVLAAGDVGELSDQRPALVGHEGADRRLLCLQPEAAMALLGD